MRRVLLSTISVLALSVGGAVAADIPRPAPVYKAPVAVPVYNWTGGYIGINGGYGLGKSDWGFVGGDADPKGGTGRPDARLQLAGWQPWVFGLEGDINWSDINGSFVSVGCPPGCETRNKWFGTVRGRVGYAIDRVMPYVTGGLAFGDVGATVTASPGRATPMSAGRSAAASKARWLRTGPPRSSISTSISARPTAASLPAAAQPTSTSPPTSFAPA